VAGPGPRVTTRPAADGATRALDIVADAR